MYLTNNTTSSSSSLLGDRNRATPDKHATDTDQHRIDLFRRMLDQEPEPPYSPPLWPSPLLSTPDERQNEASSSSASASPTQALPCSTLPAVSDKPLSDQMLSLRATTGPLAGLLLQANWQGPRLNLRLSAPSTELAARLQQEGKNLSSALSAALGVEVIVEVQRTMEDANEDKPCA